MLSAALENIVMCKVLTQDYKNPRNYTDADYENFDDYDDFPQALTTLEPFQSGFPKPVIRLLKKAKPTDYFQVGSMRIVSEDFKAEFLRAGAKVEFIEIDLLKKSREPFTDKPYYFAHLLQQVDCFDFDRSEYTMWDEFQLSASEEKPLKGKVRSCTKLVLREEVTEDCDSPALSDSVGSRNNGS